MTVQPFKIAVPQSILDDLQNRLSHTRWPEPSDEAGWDSGSAAGYMKALVDYWQHQFDWRKQEAELNKFAQYRAEIDRLGIHFIHEPGKGPNPMPLILLHGWPDSFYRYYKLIPMLTDPARFGGDPALSFDVIVPSLPGYGFSDKPAVGSTKTVNYAESLTKLMTDELGYKRFAVAGGDIGSRVARLIALRHPDSVIGLHLTGIGFPGEITFPKDIPNPSPAEQKFLGSVQGWFFTEGAYAALQSTKPQTLGFALSDSPVGLAAWIVEKFRTWSDCDGDIEKRYTKDELLTNIMIYWVTGTITSSMRLYREDSMTPNQLAAGQYIEVPAGVANFPKDLTYPPREIGERYLRVQRWTEMPHGGHFAALEVPDLLAGDMWAFFGGLR